ncbi:MAG: enoyl-CoA hydratase [Chloroflexi bacterium]|nr:enoyl-CoA hydratase [Chloroflexota bacterium]
MTPVVRLERDGKVAIITLDRPQSRNAINLQLATEVVAAIEQAQDAACIVLTGADPAFCAGLDLRSLGTEKLTDLPRYNDAVRASAAPIIGAVNGPAVTGGLELALGCDFLIGSERAAFADTHTRVGVFPGPVLHDLPQRVGAAFAREMSLTGNFVDAATALRVGLLNRVVPHAELLPTALKLARDIASQDQEMMRSVKAAMVSVNDLSLKDGRVAWREHTSRVRRRESRGADIASHRDEVLRRSRDQRS